MKIKSFYSSLFALVLALGIYVPSTFANAFGISPPWIINENLKPGSSFVYVINLSTNQTSQQMNVESVITGDQEVQDWIKIRNQSGLAMTPGQNILPMEVELNVPENAAVGQYNGNIAVRLAPVQKNDKDVAILLGGNISVELEVVDRDVRDYWVKSVEIGSVDEGMPLELMMTLKNLGNIPLSDVEAIVDLEDYNTGEHKGTVSGTKLTSAVYPHTIKETGMTLPLPSTLEPGDYWAKVQVNKDGESAYRNNLFLSIKPSSLNNVVQTAVNVSNEKGEPVMLRGAADESVGGNVRLKTSVTVRAPFTNQLIGVVIALLIVIIVLVARLNNKGSGTKRKRRK